MGKGELTVAGSGGHRPWMDKVEEGHRRAAGEN